MGIKEPLKRRRIKERKKEVIKKKNNEVKKKKKNKETGRVNGIFKKKVEKKSEKRNYTN